MGHQLESTAGTRRAAKLPELQGFAATWSPLPPQLLDIKAAQPLLRGAQPQDSHLMQQLGTVVG